MNNLDVNIEMGLQTLSSYGTKARHLVVTYLWVLNDPELPRYGSCGFNYTKELGQGRSFEEKCDIDKPECTI